MGKWTRGQWEVKDWGKPEYLDGVQMQFMVRVFDPSKIVCYCGSEQDARLLAAAHDDRAGGVAEVHLAAEHRERRPAQAAQSLPQSLPSRQGGGK